ncbi:MAG: aldo/keto reductase [Candidatus Melainabacteria bacterium HGW-Melainabacteria-1]|nr:MAG: aldo/keto reductase [Candidatus Melainabacteria bacterium HGW-Melainabacteria-1]
MEYRDYGRSGLKLSMMGFGAGQLGSPELTDSDIVRLFDALRESGVNLIDTARGYGLSEARIGANLPGPRDAWVISTKIGYGVPGVPDWTRDCILQGVDQALRTLRTDYLDIVHLHSCPTEILQAAEVIEALLETVAAGKVRVGAYSGENDALAWALRSGEFGGIQCSVNLCDQDSLKRFLPEAGARQLGVIAKRPLANAFWRFEQQPQGDYSEVYWLRWRALGLETGLPVDELALRFALYAPGVHSSIIGTRSREHLAHNLALAAKGPLPDDLLEVIRARFADVGQDWRGEL